MNGYADMKGTKQAWNYTGGSNKSANRYFIDFKVLREFQDNFFMLNVKNFSSTNHALSLFTYDPVIFL